MKLLSMIGPCEKISVNSTTVIKNDIVERLEKQPLNFLQYTINTVICQVSPTVSLSVYMISSSPRVTANQSSGQKMSRDQPRLKSRIRFITMNYCELL
ncbi:MAG: hypothetical protein KH326_01825, partial [Ruminococcus callidus]|uniref:hypothetical protein n=1 Tax=Ruminococcus callidus TaxID=40519 RepID=UPI0023EFA943